MKLSKDHRIDLTIGKETVTFILRKPSNKELNDFLADRYDTTRRGRLKDRSVAARADFFDMLLTGVENLVDDDDNPITPAAAEKIPLNWKSSIIFSEFEDVEIDEKNL